MRPGAEEKGGGVASRDVAVSRPGASGLARSSCSLSEILIHFLIVFVRCNPPRDEGLLHGSGAGAGTASGTVAGTVAGTASASGGEAVPERVSFGGRAVHDVLPGALPRLERACGKRHGGLPRPFAFGEKPPNDGAGDSALRTRGRPRCRLPARAVAAPGAAPTGGVAVREPVSGASVTAAVTGTGAGAGTGTGAGAGAETGAGTGTETGAGTGTETGAETGAASGR